MFQSLNNNNAILKMVRIHCENLQLSSKQNIESSSDAFLKLKYKADYGLKMTEILVNISLILKKNILAEDDFFILVLGYFDSFSNTDDWMDEAFAKCERAIDKLRRDEVAS